MPADGKCCDHQRKGAFPALYLAKELIARAQLRAIHAAAAEWPSRGSGNMTPPAGTTKKDEKRGGVQ